MKKLITLSALILTSSLGSALAVAKQDQPAEACPAFLDHEFKKLHSSKTVNLCDLYSGKPMVIVNTASHCGYTKQFSGLEALYQKYKDQGVQVVGFASDDFKQAAKSEQEAATICYKNYGVTFTMLAPTPVKGEMANPVFAELNKATSKPSWNFNKYLVSDNGDKVEKFGSNVKPTDSKLEKALTKAL
ncbi:glutathione peroxidase [Alteromonadaceae bacterium Bs31]|nr:glutathione peroxidase [Alteromonadaceae bacterium Bs31]